MSYRDHYVTPEQFFNRVADAAREVYFNGRWESEKQHPEDIAVNLTATIEVIAAYLSSAIRDEPRESRRSSVVKPTVYLQQSSASDIEGKPE